MTSLEEVIAEASKDRRVCPQPMFWNRLWELLPDRQRKGAGWEPPLPLILAAWWDASDSSRRERFYLHLRWAAEHGVIKKIAHLLATMKPEDWYTEQE